MAASPVTFLLDDSGNFKERSKIKFHGSDRKSIIKDDCKKARQKWCELVSNRLEKRARSPLGYHLE